MTRDEQLRKFDRMVFTDAHNREMKLRRMAVDAALSRERPVRFPVASRAPVWSGVDSLPPAGSRSYATVVVDLYPGVDDHDARVLIAEQIIRPQLREAGWNV
jgi:hypothetical protein